MIVISASSRYSWQQALLLLPLGELAKRIYVPYFVLKRIKYMINSKRTFSQLLWVQQVGGKRKLCGCANYLYISNLREKLCLTFLLALSRWETKKKYLGNTAREKLLRKGHRKKYAFATVWSSFICEHNEVASCNVIFALWKVLWSQVTLRSQINAPVRLFIWEIFTIQYSLIRVRYANWF